ncbi:Uncharacterised protein [uncultured archaeon]|nr:Uncharacterised protein [uncultured archaeon]
MKSSNTEEFTIKARKIHGNKYDYSKVNYIDWKTKICIICPIHGEFWQTPNGHLNGKGCVTCGHNTVVLQERSNTKNFVIKATGIHKNKYDYSKVKYVNNHTMVVITCKIHGDFLQTPSEHLCGYGCSVCGGNVRYTNETFAARASKVHKGKYDYTKVKYVNAHTKVVIICEKHGPFEQTPTDHLRGKGCPRCKESLGEKRINEILKTLNMNFRRQYRIPECQDKQVLPFDFGVLNEKNCLQFLIEFQGSQHFHPVDRWGGEENFVVIQNHDEIKKTFCERNNIPLLTIFYWNKNLEETIKDAIARYC